MILILSANSNQEIVNRLKTIEDTLNTVVNTNNERSRDIMTDSNKYYSNALGNSHISWAEVVQKPAEKSIPSISDRVNENNQLTAADVDIVIYGVAKNVIGAQVSNYIEQKGVTVLNCSLLNVRTS